MFTYSYDEPTGVVVALMAGNHNTDDDYARYVEMVSSPVLAGPGIRRVMYLVVDRENPVPNAGWRRKIALASASYRNNPIVAMVTASPIIRGVATALNWIRPPTYEISTFADFAAAVKWAERHRGEPLPSSARMLDLARAKAHPPTAAAG
jgi:hypothetical protein